MMWLRTSIDAVSKACSLKQHRRGIKRDLGGGVSPLPSQLDLLTRDDQWSPPHEQGPRNTNASNKYDGTA
jgi:hypothetical protein